MPRERNILWENLYGSYIQPEYPGGIDVLLYGSNRYFNLGTVSGTSGYGFRDNSGTIEWKNSGGAWATFGSSGANTALSNLASVAINTALLPNAAGTLDFGSTSKPWGIIWLSGASSTPGTNQFEITGTSTGGLRTIALPDNSGTVALLTDIPSLTGYAPLASPTFTGVIKFPDGAVGAPAITWTTDATCGFYHTGTGANGSILAAINGTQVMSLAKNINFNALVGSIAETSGGEFYLSSGNGYGTGNGGGMSMNAGTAGDVGDGGTFFMYAGIGGATSGNGGDLQFSAGNAGGSGNGGNLIFQAGIGADGGDDGTVKFVTGIEEIAGVLDFSSISTSDKTFTFPDASGTFILSEGVTGGQLITGGTAAGDYLSYKSTTGTGTAAGIAHQWLGGTNGGTVIATMLNNGNVGIGETNPGAKLEIRALGTDISGLDIQANNGNPWLVRMLNRAYSTDMGNAFVYYQAASGYLEMRNMAYGANLVLYNGKVGIGITTPTNDLSFGNASARTIWIENTANTVAGKALTIQAGSTVTAGTNNMAGGNLILSSGAGKGTGASTISFFTGTTLTTGNTLQTLSEKVTILGNGNVGIGTVSPQTLLDFPYSTNNSQVRIGSFEFQGYALNNGWFSDNIYFNGSNFYYRNTGFGVQFYLNSGAFGLFTFPSNTAGNVASGNTQRLYISNDGTIVGIGGSMGSFSATGASLTIISGNVGIPSGVLTVSGTGNSSIAGKLGIGNTSPSQSLSIGSKTTYTVSGTITPNVTGTYTLAGTANGRNYYQSTSGYIWYYGSFWFLTTYAPLGTYAGTDDFYIVDAGGADPTAGTYTAQNGASGSPSVSSSVAALATISSVGAIVGDTIVLGGAGNSSFTGSVGIGAAVPNTILHVNGGITRKVTAVAAATYDLLITDDILDVTYTATGAVTNLRLMTAQMVAGRTIVIKDGGGMAGTNNITITTEGAEQIDGADTLVINVNWGSYTLVANTAATGWRII
jgi:hypothetical protein